MWAPIGQNSVKTPCVVCKTCFCEDNKTTHQKSRTKIITPLTFKASAGAFPSSGPRRLSCRFPFLWAEAIVLQVEGGQYRVYALPRASRPGGRDRR